MKAIPALLLATFLVATFQIDIAVGEEQKTPNLATRSAPAATEPLPREFRAYSDGMTNLLAAKQSPKIEPHSDLVGVNSAKAAGAEEASDPGISPEMIDLLVDGVIAKLRAKPEILVDIVLSYEERQRQANSMIRPEDPAVGPRDADVTLVHFFDPSCAPCRATAASLEQAAAADGNVRVVIKEFPTTAEGLEISIGALAAKDYFAAHTAVLGGLQPPRVSDQSALAKASAAIQRNRELATKYHVSMLPTVFAVGYGTANRIEGPLTAPDVVARLKAIRSKQTPARAN